MLQINEVAEQIVRTIKPRRIFCEGSPASLAQALIDRGVTADSGSPAAGSYELVTCLEASDPGSIRRLAPLAETILFAPPSGDSVASWLDLFAAEGFTPDLSYDARFIAPDATLFRRGPALDPTAARLFADLLAERRLTHSLQGIQDRLCTEVRVIEERLNTPASNGINEQQLRELEARIHADLDRRVEELKRATAQSDIRAHLARLDRNIIELSRRQQSLTGRIEGILQSRTWKALTGVGGIVLRFTSRKT